MRWFGRAQLRIEALVEAHYVALYRYAYRLSGSAPEAEDLTQETFCQAQNKMFQLRDETRAKAWLFSILRNAYLHRVRAAKHARHVSLDGIPEIPEPAPEPGPPLDARQLQVALNELPELFRTPIILFYFEDFSYKEIAEQMDVPVGTIMSRLARAKSYLRERIMDEADVIENAVEGS
jgi:RNA polymerase sigma-70 factor (ECF subfamily)